MKRAVAGLTALLLASAPAAFASTAWVTNAWSRPAIGTGVVYATLLNDSSQADRLIAAKSPIAQHVELHESMSSSGPMGSMGSMASMQQVQSIAVPAHGKVILRPGGYHIMLVGLKKSLKAGMTFPLELDFARRGWTTVRVAVHAMS
jgi:periplasmic copper chaperone A